MNLVSGEFSLLHVEGEQNAETFENAVFAIKPKWQEQGVDILVIDPDDYQLHLDIQEDEFKEGDIAGARASEEILKGVLRDKMAGIARRETRLHGDDSNLITEASGEITTLALQNHGTIEAENSDREPGPNPARKGLRNFVGSQAEDAPAHQMRVVYKF